MSYLLDIFNRRQPAPEVSAPQQMPATMDIPTGGPNLPERIAPSFDTANMGTALPFNLPMTMPSGGPNTGAPMPPPGLAAMFPGGATPPPMANPGWVSPAPNPGMGGVSQMPAFQPPQPMPFTNRPMPQFGAPNFSMQNGTIGAPQTSPMNGMMKGMFGVR